MILKKLSNIFNVGFIIIIIGLASPLQAAQSAHHFTLDSANGRVSSSDFKGMVKVLYFGFASCPDICPTSLARISAAYRSLDEAQQNQIQPLFITLDPERDSIEALSSYLKYFLPSIIGLTGTPQEIAEVAKRYRISYRKTEVESGLGYVVDHASIYFIIGRDGQLFSHLLHDVTASEIANSLKQALAVQHRHDYGPVISNAVIRPNPPGHSMTSAYMNLANYTNRIMTLISATSDIAEKIEIHEYILSEGMMKMRPIHQLAIASKQTVELKPGGYHLMFFGLNKSIEKNDEVRVILGFKDNARQDITFIGSQIIKEL